MKYKNKLSLAVAGFVLLFAVIFLWYRYLYKSPRTISTERAAFVTDAFQVAEEYASNNQSADSKYLNKAIEIKGRVTAVSDSVITLDSVVFCSFEQPVDKVVLNKMITIKGRCIGYDGLFNEVKLDQCSIKQ